MKEMRRHVNKNDPATKYLRKLQLEALLGLEAVSGVQVNDQGLPKGPRKLSLAWSMAWPAQQLVRLASSPS